MTFFGALVLSLPAQAAGTAASPILIDVGSFGGGPGYTFVNSVITITENGYYTLSGTTTTNHVVVQTGTTDVNVTLDNVSIDVSTHIWTAAFDLTGATVNLTLTGANTLKSGYVLAGLRAPAGATLNITAVSTGSLTASGGSGGAGIGGGGSESGGNITINGGTIIANGGNNSGGAGVGGGFNAAGGNITIAGNANVTATGGNCPAGAGGCVPNRGGGAGIGSGGTDSATPVAAGTIQINTTGTVTAQGGTGNGTAGQGADIGEGGYDGGNGAGISPIAAPANTSAVSGGNAAFTVSVTSLGTTAPTLAYQWQVLSGGVWSNVTGATSATLNLTGVTAAMNGTKYRNVVTVTDVGTGASVVYTTLAGTLTVTDLLISTNTVPALNPVMLVLSGLLTLLLGGIVIGATEYGRRQR